MSIAVQLDQSLQVRQDPERSATPRLRQPLRNQPDAALIRGSIDDAQAEELSCGAFGSSGRFHHSVPEPFSPRRTQRHRENLTNTDSVAPVTSVVNMLAR
jgi:hypothetical protein